MGLGEQDSTLGQCIHVRRLDLGVAAEAADPVVQIVDRDEQDVVRFRRNCVGADGQAVRDEEGKERA